MSTARRAERETFCEPTGDQPDLHSEPTTRLPNAALLETIAAMRTHHEECVAPAGEGPFWDLTPVVERVVGASAIRDGRVTILLEEPSSRLFVNEWESGLLEDMARALARLGSAAATAGSSSLVLPVADGCLRLGRWQRVIALDLDPRASGRTLTVQVIGD